TPPSASWWPSSSPRRTRSRLSGGAPRAGRRWGTWGRTILEPVRGSDQPRSDRALGYYRQLGELERGAKDFSDEPPYSCARTWRCRSWASSASGWRLSGRRCCPRARRLRRSATPSTTGPRRLALELLGHRCVTSALTVTSSIDSGFRGKGNKKV